MRLKLFRYASTSYSYLKLPVWDLEQVVNTVILCLVANTVFFSSPRLLCNNTCCYDYHEWTLINNLLT